MARSRSSSRGRARSGGRSYSGGGGNNQTPMIIAIVLVVGAVGAFIFLGGGGGKKKGTPVDPNQVPEVQHPGANTNKPAGPTEPARMDPPKVGDDIMRPARDVIKQMKDEYQTASDLYDDAQLVKDDDPDQWQELLREANTHMGNIQDLWNEIVAMMPDNDDWDAEEVATNYLGRDYQQVGEIDQLRMAIRKNIRSK